MEAKKIHLNSFTVVICILYIIRHIIHIITEGIRLMTPENFIYNGVRVNIVSHTAATYNIIISGIFIVIICFILQKKKWAVVSFFIFQLINAISICAIKGDFTDIAVHIFASIVCCFILFLLLLLRNEGKSGWKVIFQDSTITFKKHNSHPKTTQIEDIMNPINAVYPIDNEKKCKTAENNNENKENEANKELWNKASKLSGIQKRKKRLLCVSLGILLIILLALTFGYQTYNTPERRYAEADTLFSHGNIKESLEAFKYLADKDNYSPAKTKLGILYLTNDSVPMDSVKGFEYLEETAIIDSTALEYLIYLYGGKTFKGIKHTNTTKANKYAQMALEQNKCIGAANLCLGSINIDNKKYELAYYYLTEAAKYRIPMANTFIGWLYLNGYGCEENDQKAREYFQKELSIGEEENALFFLGMIYKEGWGVDVSTHTAIKYLRSSAKLGNDDAKEELAKMKIKGIYNEDIFNIWEK